MTGQGYYEFIGFQSDHPEPRQGPPDAPDLTRAAIFLNVDGTLIDIADFFEIVSAPASTRAVVNALHAKTDGATVLVSGRAIRDLDRLFPDFPGIVVGSHGAEQRVDGALWQHSARDSRDLERLVQMVRTWADSEPELVVEEKPCSVVLHFRKAPDRMADALHFMDCVTNHAEGFVLHRARMKMAAEIFPADVSKGSAVETLMARWPARRPIAFGDDLGDEGVFEVVNRFGGQSIRIGDGETCAAFRLADPGEVLDTLRDWLGRSSG